MTGEKAENWYKNIEKKYRNIEMFLNKPQDIMKALNNLIEEKNSLQKQTEKFLKVFLNNFKNQLVNNVTRIGEVSFVKAIAEEPVNNR